ncbi:MAG: alpha/beta hydrolase-fold protein [Planctomycetaceae bacterium]
MTEVTAQQFRSPEVHADRSVTLRLLSKTAILVRAELAGQKLQMTKGDNDVWEVTTESLPAGIHDYAFDVDGTRVIDPCNRNVKKWFTMASMVEIPGSPPLLTEFRDVPHGDIHRMIYPSNSVAHDRPVMVYTPPGYDEADAATLLPVVYLLHGFGDDETAWTEVGRAHFIVDNLLADGKISPCVVVMPYGHPVPPPFGKRPDDYFIDNNSLYERDLMTDLLPFIERKFRVRRDAAGRSIAGLSMGGGHAIDTGLRNPDGFSAIGAFSAAAPEAERENLEQKYPSIHGSDPAANRLKTFWIPIGDRDFLLERNEKFVALLTKNGVKHDFVRTSGGHEWKLWREYFPEFLLKVVGRPSGQ